MNKTNYGIIQLITNGSGDLFLTGNPEITFFKCVYRRHTNFSIESIEVPFNNYVNFNKTSMINIPKIGDLVNKIYLKAVLPSIAFKDTNISNYKVYENINLDDLINILTNDDLNNDEKIKKIEKININEENNDVSIKPNNSNIQEIDNNIKITIYELINNKLLELYNNYDILKDYINLFMSLYNKIKEIYETKLINIYDAYNLLVTINKTIETYNNTKLNLSDDTLLQYKNKLREIISELIKKSRIYNIDRNIPLTEEYVDIDLINIFFIYKINLNKIIEVVEEITEETEEYNVNPLLSDYETIINENDKTEQEKEKYINEDKSWDEMKLERVKKNIELIKRRLKDIDYKYCLLINEYEKIMKDIQNDNCKFAWVEKIGYALIDYIEVSIGGNKIDKQYGQWMEIWNELTSNKQLEEKFNELIGNVKELTDFNKEEKEEYTLYVPLQFWFNKYIGLSLPLVALENNDVQLKFKFRSFQELTYINKKFTDTYGSLDNLFYNNNKQLKASLLIDYIYLDTNERLKFARAGHEYLIEQIQINTEKDLIEKKHSIKLNFNHPVKGLVWVIQRSKDLINNDNLNKCLWFDYTLENSNIDYYFENLTEEEIEELTEEQKEQYKIDKSTFKYNPILSSSLTFNDKDRFKLNINNYYNYLQSYQHFNNSPKEGINSYWFSLMPNEYQPSGECNMSDIPEIRLTLNINPYFENTKDTYNLYVYAVNYNILRIIGGFGNIAYV